MAASVAEQAGAGPARAVETLRGEGGSGSDRCQARFPGGNDSGRVPLTCQSFERGERGDEGTNLSSTGEWRRRSVVWPGAGEGCSEGWTVGPGDEQDAC